MKTQLLAGAFALLLTAIPAAGADAPFTLVALSDSADTARPSVSIRVKEVRDLRKLAANDPQLLGTWSPLPFETRTALRTQRPVALEVRDLLRKANRSDSGIPVRIDLLSFETWSDPLPGPDPVHASVRLRIVSLDSARPGLIVEPQASGERKFATRAVDQTDLLTSLLFDAVAMAKPPYRTSPDTGASIPEPNSWTNPSATPAPAAGRRTLRQILSGSAILGAASVGAGVRYTQFLEPSGLAWTPEYWGGFQLRGPWNDKTWAKVWSGELQGGIAWNRRMDAGASSWVVVGSAGGLLGVEGSRPAHEDGTVGERKTFVYIGAEGRALVRWQPLVSPGLSWSVGPEISLRLPSRLGWIDPALVGEVGWRF